MNHKKLNEVLKAPLSRFDECKQCGSDMSEENITISIVYNNPGELNVVISCPGCNTQYESPLYADTFEKVEYKEE